MKQNFSNHLGFIGLCLMYICTAFHMNMYILYPFYREAFSGLFIILIIWLLCARTNIIKINIHSVNKDLLYLLLFPIILIIWASFDPGVMLYESNDADFASTQINGIPLALYVIRNSVIYLPMVLYCYLRGLTKKEINWIAVMAVLVAPISINEYLASVNMGSIFTIGGVVEKGSGIAYNTYVPYITFSVLCGFYILFGNYGVFIKSIVLIFIIFTIIFTLFSNSRQSILFLMISVLPYFYYSFKKGNFYKKFASYIIVGVTFIFAFLMATDNYNFSDNFLSRYTSLENFFMSESSGRFDIFLDGLYRIDPFEWLYGAGLTSVIFSGPHNDYLRWTQRVGLPLMIFGFLPFISIFSKCLKKMNFVNDQMLCIFLCSLIWFTIFHSFFGYPREDAYEAVGVYFGLGLWFGAVGAGTLRAQITKSRFKVLGDKRPSKS